MQQSSSLPHQRASCLPARDWKARRNAFVYTAALCRNLRVLRIPESVTSLGNGCFMSLTRLVDCQLPTRVNVMGTGLFYLCSHLPRLALPLGVGVIPARTCECKVSGGCTWPRARTVQRAQYAYCSLLLSPLSSSTTVNALLSFLHRCVPTRRRRDTRRRHGLSEGTTAAFNLKSWEGRACGRVLAAPPLVLLPPAVPRGPGALPQVPCRRSHCCRTPRRLHAALSSAAARHPVCSV